MSTNAQQTAITKEQPTELTIRDMLAKNRKAIESVLPKHLTPDRLMRIIINCISQTPALQKCSVSSLYRAALAAAETGLEPGGVRGEAYIVPYGTEATFIIGYRGLRKLALQSGYIASIYANAVHKNDKFSFSTGVDIKLQHEPCLDGDPGELRLVYAVAKFKDSSIDPVVVVMTKSQVDAIRERSKASKNGPWVTDYEEMAKKTAIRRIAKSVPLSADDESDRFEMALNIDNQDFDASGALPSSTTAPPQQQAPAQLTSNTTVEVPASAPAEQPEPVPSIAAAQQLVDLAQQQAHQPKPTPPAAASEKLSAADEEGLQWLESCPISELAATWQKLQARKDEMAPTPAGRRAWTEMYKRRSPELKGAKS